MPALKPIALSWLVTALLFPPLGAQAGSLSLKPTTTNTLPLRLTGKDVPALSGVDPVGVSVLACHGGKLAPIPFQVDEFDQLGRLVSASGASARKQDESPRAIDDNDELALMQRDLGEKCDIESLSRINDKLIEVEVRLPHFKESAWFYIVAGERGLVPATRLVNFDPKLDRVTSSAYGWGYRPGAPHIFDYLTLVDFQRPSFDLMDRLKVRMKAKALGKLIEISVNEDEISSRLDVVKAGPVRVIRDVGLEVTPVPGLTIEAFVIFAHYERYWDAVVHFRMPVHAALFTSSLDVTFFQDFTDLKGAQFSTAALPTGALIDGRMLESERSMAFGDQPWFLVSGRGLNMVTVIQYEKNLSLSGRIQFADDPLLRTPPEDNPGALPLVGFELTNWENLKAQWYSFSAQQIFLTGFPEGGGSGFYAAMRAAPVFESRVLQGK